MNNAGVEPSSCTGIILAGGKSSRLGQEKGLLMYQGMTLAQRAVKVLSVFCDRILIITANPLYQQDNVELIPDLVPEQGPMMGIYSGLKASVNLHNLVLAVDNPFVTTAFYAYLLQKPLISLAAVPFIQNKYFEPLIGYYHHDILSSMEHLIKQGNFKLPDLLESVSAQKLKVESEFHEYFPGYFNSINLPQDMQLLR